QSNDKVAVYVDNSTLELVRAHAGKDAQRYPLEVGPEGFAVAKVDGATVPTEERAAEHSNSEGSEPHRKNEYSKMFYKA
ncbi:unnamed protein product, partial [Effrenium voratum]